MLVLRWRHFGYVWNWPLGISIVRGGQVERRAIVDVTRWLLWGSWLAALLMLLAPAAQCRQKHARKGQVQK